MTDVSAPPHPARFSDAILDYIKPLIQPHARVLDPFAGTGRVHEIEAETWGIEIEPEWADMHPQTLVGDALALPFADDAFDTVVTSPCYGNRMADSHNAQERCKPCGGTGWVAKTPKADEPAIPLVDLICAKCGGEGRRQYKRLTYTHQLGRPLHENSSGKMQWGPTYQRFHVQAWMEVKRVLMPGGVFFLNVSNHIRAGEEIDVAGWHAGVLMEMGFVLLHVEDIETPRMGFGANRDARVEAEHVYVFRA